MSLLSNVSDGIVKISGENHIFSTPVTECNLFVEVTGDIQLNARVQIENRATLIGNYIFEEQGSLHARKIEIFKSTNKMLESVNSYASGEVPNKSALDSAEILLQFLTASEGDKSAAYLALTDLFIKNKIDVTFIESTLPILESAHGGNANLKEALVSLQIILSKAYIAGKIRGKSATDAMPLLQKITTLGVCNIENSKLLAELTDTLLSNEGFDMASAIRVTEENLKRNPIDQFQKTALIGLYSTLGLKYHVQQPQKIYASKAVEELEKAFKLDPNHPDTQKLLALFYTDLCALYLNERIEAKYNEAIVILEKAITLNPNLGGAYYNLAEIYCLRDKTEINFEKVVGLFEKALSLMPNDPLVKSELVTLYSLRATLYISGQMKDKPILYAVDLMEKTFALDPHNQSTIEGLSIACIIAAIACLNDQIPEKTSADGMILLERALEFKVELPANKMTLSFACNQYAVACFQGKIPGKTNADAIALLKQSLKLNPLFIEAQQNLAFLSSRH